MLSSQVILFFIVLLLLALLLEPLAEKINLPFSIVLVVIGYVASEFSVHVLELDTGIRWDNFKPVIFYVILPVLIFQAALEIRLEALWRNLLPILILALPLMLVSTLVTALFVYTGIDHPVGFPWIAALITGALLSATDPAAVLSLMNRAGAPERLRVLLEGESLFNDATAVVLFVLLIGIAMSGHDATDYASLLSRFVEVFMGGLLTGFIIALILKLLSLRLASQQMLSLLSTAGAYSSFIVAEDLFHFSGVISVLACGMTFGFLQRGHLDHDSFCHRLWQLLNKLAESMIFLLAGITVTLAMFIDQWLAIVIGIVAVTLARFAVIFGSFPLLALLPGVEPVPFRQQAILVWGGVRGTVTLALALSLPLTLDYWYTIQSIAYGVVLFTLFVQTTSMPYLLGRR